MCRLVQFASFISCKPSSRLHYCCRSYSSTNVLIGYTGGLCESGIRLCSTNVKAFLSRQIRHRGGNGPKPAPNELRRKHLKNLLGTLQLKQNSMKHCAEPKTLSQSQPLSWQKEAIELPVESVSNPACCESCCPPNLQCIPGTLPSTTEQTWANSVHSFARKMAVEQSKPYNELKLPSAKSKTDTDISVNDAKLKKKAAKSSARNSTDIPQTSAKLPHFNISGKRKKLHIEHREDRRTHFSRATVADLHEHLSTDELNIISQLVRAVSLPEDVRQSLQVYLDRQKISSTDISLPIDDLEIMSNADAAKFTNNDLTEVFEDLSLPASVQPKSSKTSKKSKVKKVSLEQQMRDEVANEVFCDDLGELYVPSEPLPSSSSKKKTRSKKHDLPAETSDTKGLPLRPYWTEEEVQDSFRLKEMLERTAKLLQPDKKVLIEQALEHDRQIKENVYLAKMASFVELCINTGMQKQAQSVLTSCYLRSRGKPRSHRGARAVHDINVYNRLMHSWAKQGNMEAIRKLFLQIEGLGLQPTFQTFGICLECLGRQITFQLDAVKRVLRDIDKANFRLEAIFNECHFVAEEEHVILKTIRAVLPDFTPDPHQQNDDYTCSLLTPLNGSRQPVPNPFVGVVSPEELGDRIARQMKIETVDRVPVDSILPPATVTPHILAARDRLTAQKQKWRDALRRAFLTSRQHLYSHGDTSSSILPYLKLWKADAYVDLMMQEIDILGQDMAVYSPTFASLHYQLGSKVYNKYIVQVHTQGQHVEKLLHLYKEYLKLFNCTTLSGNHRQLWTDLMADMKYHNLLYSESEIWPSSVTKSIGKFLYSLIMSEVKVQVTHTRKIHRDKETKETNESDDKNTSASASNEIPEIPAFFAIFRMRNNMMLEEVMPHPFLVRLYNDAQLIQLTFEPCDMPSLVPPVPWFTHNYGGSLLGTTELIRQRTQTHQQQQIVKKLPPQTLYPMFDGLNTASCCPWTVNKPILDLIIEVFNKGGNTKLDIPEMVDRSQELPHPTPEMSDEERFKVIQQNRKVIKERNESYSQWCTELYRLSIANKYRDDVFWFSHNMDFRGRIYPLPAHFNHFGSDVARSILMFGRAKPLGPQGLDWLKIHLVNLTGFKKRRPNRERLDFANEIMTEIMDSADHPFTGRRWWQTSDEPWQTLACCMEITNAVRSPNPEEFLSRIPVHQDGSCNVLQHYAALGRDVIGAQSVNLNPFDAPKDVYSDVLELVEKKRQEDALNGVAIAQSLEGFLQRKVIKQTIMTSVYGVTKYGARRQVDNQLRHNVDNFPPELVFDARAYLVEKTFESLHVMFTTNKAIQDWLVTCADIISRIRQQPVGWVTPLGWPVLQPYFKAVRLQDKKKTVASYDKPNTVKQKNAVPPNFIHSLDSAHMMLTAVHCLRAGIMFASIHDCFWTHACDVPVMNKICREQFVALHSTPILANVANAIVDQYGFPEAEISSEESPEKKQAKEFVNYLLKRIPKQGTFDIRKVLESTYFFS